MRPLVSEQNFWEAPQLQAAFPLLSVNNVCGLLNIPAVTKSFDEELLPAAFPLRKAESLE